MTRDGVTIKVYTSEITTISRANNLLDGASVIGGRGAVLTTGLGHVAVLSRDRIDYEIVILAAQKQHGGYSFDVSTAADLRTLIRKGDTIFAKNDETAWSAAVDQSLDGLTNHITVTNGKQVKRLPLVSILMVKPC